jgi:hypothetical protein
LEESEAPIQIEIKKSQAAMQKEIKESKASQAALQAHMEEHYFFFFCNNTEASWKVREYCLSLFFFLIFLNSTHTYQVNIRKIIDYDINFIIHRLGGSSFGSQASESNI